jgi:hypothetical protein
MRALQHMSSAAALPLIYGFEPVSTKRQPVSRPATPGLPTHCRSLGCRR